MGTLYSIFCEFIFTAKRSYFFTVYPFTTNSHILVNLIQTSKLSSHSHMQLKLRENSRHIQSIHRVLDMLLCLDVYPPIFTFIILHLCFQLSFSRFHFIIFHSLSLLGVLSLLGNGILMLVAYRKRLSLKPAEFFIINLSISDLGMTLSLFPLATPSAFAHKYLIFFLSSCSWNKKTLGNYREIIVILCCNDND